MDKSILSRSAEAVSMFCRLNINTKKNLPIRSSEMGMLILIVKTEHAVTPVMVAEFFKVSKPMVASMISNLTKAGYITKVPSTEDKRSFTLIPTEKAVSIVETTYSEYLKTMQLLADKLGYEKFTSLITLLEQANEILIGGND